ncbi:uncharacterized protein LOC121052275 [Rosa chinensis]|uniref:uncharacterized protein LOC121052275 n=1 Tax=Rosa chinensis TaxID=74649 RepID=UPI001AD8B763|nr:uncharacterized protein LOC121052275 [Rosa chinensis]
MTSMEVILGEGAYPTPSIVANSPEVLLTRIKVGPKPDQTGSDGGGGGVAGSSSSVKSDSRAVSKCEANIQLAEECKVSLSSVAGMSFAGGSAAGSVPQWPMDEFMGFTYFDQSIGYMDNGSSKANCGKLGDSDSSILRSSEAIEVC